MWMRLIAVATVAMGLGAPELQAQSRLSTDVPAEFPPASYSARQYVDSRGCVYVRAGIDGATDWVPRVARSRRHICGQTPTFAQAAPAPAPARPAPQTAEVIEPRPVPQPAPAARSAAATPPAAVPRAQRAQRPAPQPVRRATRPAPQQAARPRRARAPIATVAGARPGVARTPASKPASAPPPALVRKVPKTPTVARTVRVADRTQASCPGASAVSQRYIRSDRGLAVRCGPQATPHVTRIKSGTSPAAGRRVYVDKGNGWREAGIGNKTVIVPRHVYENRVRARRVVPEGYKPAFDDGRFNPRRAWQTVEGYRVTRLQWTNTVPRRLINAATGEDVTALYPNIVYRANATEPLVMTRAEAQRGARRAVVSTRGRAVISSRAGPVRPARAARARFVEIGLFTKPDLAARTVERFQRLGLPVKYGISRRDGQMVKRVLLGPYGTPAALERALGQARAAGYPRAYLR